MKHNLEQNRDDFKILIRDLVSIDHKVKNETQAIILLNSSPEKYKEVKFGIIYLRDEWSLDMIISNLRSNDLEFKTNKRSTINYGLYVRGRSDRK